MEKSRKRFYYIFIPIASILFFIVFLYPAKKKAPSSVIEDNIQSEAAVTTPAEIFITTDDNEINSNGKEFKKLVFARDIFKSPYEKKEAAQEIKDIDNQMKEEKEEVPPPKISGVFLSRAGGKTFLTADGKIVGENETINGYKVLKILKEEVLFEKSNGKIIKVNIWEE